MARSWYHAKHLERMRQGLIRVPRGTTGGRIVQEMESLHGSGEQNEVPVVPRGTGAATARNSATRRCSRNLALCSMWNNLERARARFAQNLFVPRETACTSI